jgi:hypothetical protein
MPATSHSFLKTDKPTEQSINTYRMGPNRKIDIELVILRVLTESYSSLEVEK